MKKEIIGNATLYLGDCLEILPTLGKVDAVITDPPYGTTQCKWDSVIDLQEMWGCIGKCVSNETPVAIFGCEPFSSVLRLSNINNFKYDWVWDKPKGTGFLNANKQPMRNHELISIFYKNQCLYNPQKTSGHKLKVSTRGDKDKQVYGDYKGNVYSSEDRFPRSIQEFSSDTQNTSLHPTQKPVALLEYLIKTYSDAAALILDFTMGSGTTGVACMNLGRKFIGIEIEPKYFNIACERIEQAQKQGRLFA